MTQRENIERIYEDHGLDALWKWAQGHPDRWKALKEWATAKAQQLGDELDRDRKQVEGADDDIHRLADERDDVLVRVADNQKALREAKARGDAKRQRELEARAEELATVVSRLAKRIASNEVQKKRALVEAHHDKQQRKAWIERKVIYREKWEKAKERHQSSGGGFANAKWEDWMGAGLDANVTPFVKQVVAWGILEFDLVATSLRRTYVPPGGSTTSYHMTTPGKAGDIAGSRMSEFQQALYDEFLGNGAMLEMFGPLNDRCLKYGGQLVLGEGTALENLHDTHVHAAG